MKQKLTILFIALATLAATAQMTLRDCLLYAREHAHTGRIARIEADKAGVDRRIALAAVLPYASFDVGGNMSFGRNIDPETNTYDNKKTVASSFGLGISIPVFDGLVSINNIKGADMASRRQRQSAQAQADEISIAVVRSFYNVSYCRAMVAQMEEALARDSTSLAATRRGVELGTKSEADAADMEALVASDRYELTNQQHLLAKAYMQLKADMGMEPDDEPLELVEDGNTGSRAADPAFVHPEVQAAEFALRENIYRLRAARGAFSPTVKLNAGLSTSYFKMIDSKASVPSFSQQWHNNMGQYVGVSFSLPLFNGLAGVNNVKKARLSLEQSRLELEQKRYETERKMAETAFDCSAAADELQAAVKRLEAEQKAYRATSRKFELGGASAIDLYTSSAKLSVARATVEGKRIQLIINNIILSYYKGTPLI